MGTATLRSAAHRAAAGLVLAALAASSAAAPAAKPAAPTARLDRLYAACVDAMVASTCTAMNDKDAATGGSPNDVVLVVGVGRVNAASYRRIRAYGEAMCGEVRKACQADPAGNECRVGQALWGAAAR